MDYRKQSQQLHETDRGNGKKAYELYGMPWYVFAIFAVIVLAATYMGILPKGMIGAIPLMLVFGTILDEIGAKVPIVNSYLGGGAIVIIFGSAAGVYYHLLPQEAIKTITNFMKGEGFLDFYIAALITGSILGMNRKLLIKAALRYLPALIGGVAVAIALAALVGAATGYGAKEAVLFIAVPIMGGGMGAGAVPLSKIFGESLGKDPSQMLSIMVPAVAMGNALAIVCAGLLNRLGKTYKKLSGSGQLMRVSKGPDTAAEQDQEFLAARDDLKLTNMGIGLFIATSFFALGQIIGSFIPAIHPYAWMILAVAFVKITNILPQKFEICCYQWFQFIMKNLTGLLLVGIGVAYTNLGQVLAAFSVQYLILVGVTVLGAILGSAAVGWLMGFYPIEASITAGLCMANMGGTGDVAVLSAARRMELMPFAQISSRIGGAFMLILSSVLLQIIR